MDNPKPCKNCGKVNTSDSKFCNQCGRQLPGGTIDSVVDDSIKNEIEALVKVKMDRLVEFAAGLEDKIELDCRKKIDGWFSKGGILGVILLGLGGVTAGFQVESLKDTMQQTREQVDQVKAKAEQTRADIEKTKSSVPKMKQELDSIKDYIMKDKREIDKTKEEIISQANTTKTQIENAQGAISQIQGLRETTKSFAAGVIQQSKELLGSVKRTENATFDIFIDYAGESDNVDFKQTLNKLQENGFRISFSNVAQIKVNLNEIVYFSELNISKAEEIKDILKPFYKDIQIRKKNSDRGARDLLLKLKSETD